MHPLMGCIWALQKTDSPSINTASFVSFSSTNRESCLCKGWPFILGPLSAYRLTFSGITPGLRVHHSKLGLFSFLLQIVILVFTKLSFHLLIPYAYRLTSSGIIFGLRLHHS